MNLVVFIIFGAVVIITTAFVLLMYNRRNVRPIHISYFALAGVATFWLLAEMSLFFNVSGNETFEWIVDCVTYIGAYIPVLALFVSLCFINGWDKMPRWLLLLLIVPTLTQLVVWTNPYHHFFYVSFSRNMEQIGFGWYFYLHSVYSYICTLLSALLIIIFALKSKSKLYLRQALLIACGNLLPLIVNLWVTSGIISSTLGATPMSYCISILFFHGTAIFRLHILDIKPMAMKTILDMITDCYLVVTSKGLVDNYNRAFASVFGRAFGISDNTYLTASDSAGAGIDTVGLHTLITGINACRASNTTISYEQTIMTQNGDETVKKYYIVDITALNSNDRNVGFVIFFKDVTKLKESMQRLQNSQARLMEQERLASLGQMIGGIAHNMKTPIMSIAGSATSVNTLITEAQASLGDEEVTPDDYREIYGEMREWLSRVQDACAYMSDILTAVKGQAAQLSGSDDSDFMLDDVIKRVRLLMRHELVGNNVSLVVDNNAGAGVSVHGDINTMVQVINNLVGNAVDAEKEKGGGYVKISIDLTETHLQIRVADNGDGIPDDVKKHLFKQMVTSKGAMGTGLGIFISNSSIKAKFGGSMWFEDNPEGGTIFGISIPLDYVTLGDADTEGDRL